MIWIALSVLSNIIATVLLKINSSSLPPLDRSGLFGLVNLLPALLAYCIAFISYRQSLLHFQVSVAYAIITSLTAIAVGLIGALAFGEVLNLGKVIGLALVCMGIVVLSSAPTIQ